LEWLSLLALAGLVLFLPLWRHRVLLHRAGEPVFFETQDVILYTNDLLLWAALGAWFLSRLVAPAPARLRFGPWFIAGPLLGFLLLAAAGAPFAVDPLSAAYQSVRLLVLLALYLLLVNLRLAPGGEPDRGNGGATPQPAAAAARPGDLRSAVAWPMAGAMVLQAAVAAPQFIMRQHVGLGWLGEIPVKAGWPGASVVMVGEERWLRAYGLTQHPNLLGGLLMVMLLVTGGYYLVQRGWRRWPLVAALGLGFVALLLTFSRAAWMGLLLGGGAMVLLLLWARRRGTWSPDWRTVGVAIAVLALLVVAFALANWSLLQPRLGMTSQGTEIRSVESRGTQVPAALELIRMRPLLGVGLHNYPTALYRLAREMVAAYPVYQPVFNVVLLASAELGIAGGVLWLALVILPWLGLLRHRLRLHLTPWWAGLSGALLAMSAVSIIDFYFWTSHQGPLILWLVLGLWAREWVANAGQ
jgi:O-antigen ligase